MASVAAEAATHKTSGLFALNKTKALCRSFPTKIFPFLCQGKRDAQSAEACLRRQAATHKEVELFSWLFNGRAEKIPLPFSARLPPFPVR